MRCLLLGFQRQRAFHAQAEHRQIVVVERSAVAGIGRITQTGADVLALVLEHAHQQRQGRHRGDVAGRGRGRRRPRALRARVGRVQLLIEDGAHVGVDFHAGEVAGVLQARLVGLQLGFAVVVARLNLVQVSHHRCRIALQAFDAQFAEAQLRAAVQHHAQQRHMRIRIDGGLGFGQLCARVAGLHHLAQDAALGRFPVGLAEHRPRLQRPAGAQGVGVELLVGRLAGRHGKALQHQLDLAHAHRLARLHRHQHGWRGGLGIKARADHRRVIAVGRHQCLDLLRRHAHQPLQLLAVDARVAAKAHQVQILLQQLLQRARRVDAHLVLQALGADRTGHQQAGQGQSSGYFCRDLCQNSKSC